MLSISPTKILYNIIILFTKYWLRSEWLKTTLTEMRICLHWFWLVDLREADDGPNFDWWFKIRAGNLKLMILLFEFSRRATTKKCLVSNRLSSLRQRLDSYVISRSGFSIWVSGREKKVLQDQTQRKPIFICKGIFLKRNGSYVRSTLSCVCNAVILYEKNSKLVLL